MMFPSFALLSGIVLFSSAVAAVTIEVNVGDGFVFEPPYIVRPQISLYVEALSLLSFRTPLRETPFRLSSLPITP